MGGSDGVARGYGIGFGDHGGAEHARPVRGHGEGDGHVRRHGRRRGRGRGVRRRHADAGPDRVGLAADPVRRGAVGRRPVEGSADGGDRPGKLSGPVAGAAIVGVEPCDDGAVLMLRLFVPLDAAEAAHLAAALDGAVLAGLFGDGPGAPAPRAAGGRRTAASAT